LIFSSICSVYTDRHIRVDLSEVPWFPYFLDLCKQSRSYRDDQCMDHEDMTRIVEECTGYRDVQAILNRSRGTAFKDEIWDYRRRAMKCVKMMRRAERKLEESRRLRERIYQWLESS